MNDGTFYSILFLIVFCSLLILLFIARKFIKKMDSVLTSKLREIFLLKQRGGDDAHQEYGFMPGASYNVKCLTPEGHLINEENYSCSGETLQQALQGIQTMRLMAREDQPEEAEEDKNIKNYFG